MLRHTFFLFIQEELIDLLTTPLHGTTVVKAKAKAKPKKKPQEKKKDDKQPKTGKKRAAAKAGRGGAAKLKKGPVPDADEREVRTTLENSDMLDVGSTKDDDTPDLDDSQAIVELKPDDSQQHEATTMEGRRKMFFDDVWVLIDSTIGSVPQHRRNEDIVRLTIQYATRFALFRSVSGEIQIMQTDFHLLPGAASSLLDTVMLS